MSRCLIRDEPTHIHRLGNRLAVIDPEKYTMSDRAH